MRKARMKGTKICVSLRVMVGVVVLLMMVGVGTAPMVSSAKSQVKLSRTKRTYDLTGVYDKIRLKNTPSGAKITWKSSNSKVVKVSSHIKGGIWYKVIRKGSADIIATYKGKKYVCKIKVKPMSDASDESDKSSGTEGTDPSGGSDSSGDSGTSSSDRDVSGIRLNATDITLYYCPKDLMPYCHDYSKPSQFQLKVIGTDVEPTWKIDFDTLPGIRVSSKGVVDFADIYLSSKKEATITACFPAKLDRLKLSAKVHVISETAICYEEKIADFKDRYITADMSDYDKVDAVCRYISHEFDYETGQYNWATMVIKGSGDCLASRVGVEILCRDLGIRAFACCNFEDHGKTMVRIGDDVYMTVTGYGGPKPRHYDFYKMSETAIAAMKAKYRGIAYYLGDDV